MDDTISRQVAIDALFELYEYQRDIDPTEAADLVRQGILLAEKKIEQLSSAQPEQPKMVQDILQYLDEYLHPIVSPEHWSVYSVLYDMVSVLPSAQPEKTQLSGESTTKDSTFDCISRQAAIEALGEKPLVWDDLSDFDLGKAAQWSDDVDAIKALPSTQPQPCKDAVSKADVLETYAELYDVFDDNKEIKNELHKIYDKINALQTAQPQSTMDQVTYVVQSTKDCISRQAAIEAMNTRLEDIKLTWRGKVKKGEIAMYLDMRGVIETLPSTQPEIIRCNVCRHWHQTTGEMKGFGLGDCDYLEKKLVTCNGYCYWAERKDDE